MVSVKAVWFKSRVAVLGSIQPLEKELPRFWPNVVIKEYMVTPSMGPESCRSFKERTGCPYSMPKKNKIPKTTGKSLEELLWVREDRALLEGE